MIMALRRLSTLLLFFALIGTAQSAYAQQSMRFRGSDGWGAGTRYESLFDNLNLQTVTGTVVRVDTATVIFGEMSVAVRLVVALDGGSEIPVHLGPMWFALNQDVNFPRGEKLEIRGHRTSFSGAEFIMPVEMRSKNRIFRFRDDDGNPFWSIHRPR